MFFATWFHMFSCVSANCTLYWDRENTMTGILFCQHSHQSLVTCSVLWTDIIYEIILHDTKTWQVVLSRYQQHLTLPWSLYQSEALLILLLSIPAYCLRIVLCHVMLRICEHPFMSPQKSSSSALSRLQAGRLVICIAWVSITACFRRVAENEIVW